MWFLRCIYFHVWWFFLQQIWVDLAVTCGLLAAILVSVCFCHLIVLLLHLRCASQERALWLTATPEEETESPISTCSLEAPPFRTGKCSSNGPNLCAILASDSPHSCLFSLR